MQLHNVHQDNMTQMESNVRKYALCLAGWMRKCFQEKKMLEAALPKPNAFLRVLEVILAAVKLTDVMWAKETAMTIVIAWMD